MTIEVLPQVEAELAEAVEYYNQQSPGRGYELALEVKEAFERVASFPTAWPPYRSEARRCLVRRFPYGVLYLVEADRILVVGIMHLHREPSRWDARLQTAGVDAPRRVRR